MNLQIRQLAIALLGLVVVHSCPALDEEIRKAAVELKRNTPYETLAACQAFVLENVTETPSEYG